MGKEGISLRTRYKIRPGKNWKTVDFSFGYCFIYFRSFPLFIPHIRLESWDVVDSLNFPTFFPFLYYGCFLNPRSFFYGVDRSFGYRLN